MPPAQPMVSVALLLAVEVEEVLAPCSRPGWRFVGAGEAGLLVDGDEELEGAVRDVLGGHDRQGRGHADAVVGAEGGARRPEPVAVAHHPDGIAGEVVVGAFVLLADHVHVGLAGRWPVAPRARPPRLRTRTLPTASCSTSQAERPGLLEHPVGRRLPRSWSRGGSSTAPGSSARGRGAGARRAVRSRFVSGGTHGRPFVGAQGSREAGRPPHQRHTSDAPWYPGRPSCTQAAP